MSSQVSQSANQVDTYPQLTVQVGKQAGSRVGIFKHFTTNIRLEVRSWHIAQFSMSELVVNFFCVSVQNVLNARLQYIWLGLGYGMS